MHTSLPPTHFVMHCTNIVALSHYWCFVAKNSVVVIARWFSEYEITNKLILMRKILLDLQNVRANGCGEPLRVVRALEFHRLLCVTTYFVFQQYIPVTTDVTQPGQPVFLLFFKTKSLKKKLVHITAVRPTTHRHGPYSNVCGTNDETNGPSFAPAASHHFKACEIIHPNDQLR